MEKMKLNIQLFGVVLNNKLSNGTSPYAYYTVEASYSNRTATTVDVSVTVTSNLRYSSSSFGTGNNNGLNAYFKFNGTQYGPLSLKRTNETWSGTTKHYKSETYTIRNLSTNTSSLNIQFRVDRTGSKEGTTIKSDGCWLEWTTCSSLSIDTGTKYVPTMSLALQKHETNPIWYNMTNTYAWIDWICTNDSTISSINQLQITYGVSGQNGTTIYRNVSGKSGSFQLDGLNGNTAYWVNVYGRSSDGIWSTTAAVVTFTTYSDPINISSITITSLLPTSVTVSVVPSTTNNLEQYSYMLFSGDDVLLSTIYSKNNSNTFTGLTPTTNYYVVASAIPYNQGAVSAEGVNIFFETPADKASIWIKLSTGWQKGKIYIKTDSGWVSGKNIYIKTDLGWVKGTN